MTSDLSILPTIYLLTFQPGFPEQEKEGRDDRELKACMYRMEEV
jgi:hypothetical protein